MNNKSIRDYINLIENAQKKVEESTDFAGRQVDQDLVRRQEKYWNQAAKEKKQQELKRSKELRKSGVAEGLNEFAPDGFNGGDDDEEFSPKIAKMAQEDGFTKGVSLADGATLERAMKINYWHSQHGGIYKQYFAKGFKAGRMNKVKHDNKQYNLNLKLMKDGSIRHGEQGVAEEQLEETTPEAVEKVERLTQK